MSVGESESLERLSSNSVGLFYITLKCVGKRKGDEALCSWIWVILLFTKEEEVFVPHPYTEGRTSSAFISETCESTWNIVQPRVGCHLHSTNDM